MPDFEEVVSHKVDFVRHRSLSKTVGFLEFFKHCVISLQQREISQPPENIPKTRYHFILI